MEATFVKKLDGFRGDARLYKLSRPYKWGNDEVTATVDHVVASGVVAYSGPETYVFPATSDGEIADWSELDGSFRGAIDHEEAINGFLESVTEGE